ncbi:concanavalin A-like lectin/glucanases superfamily protein [Kordia sp. SMS9]|uniref:LamG domain-containing protein n=1 Tax=Kordia sp. SMS9 TaxID=2282170 RepID=UPI000E105A65|nr:LamG domain-containing protein [Kordia sp. SMS9]AXG67837.1 concanavalin A-like lectin/glucanases superfamily protein [Kordia sp. SMS9]
MKVIQTVFLLCAIVLCLYACQEETVQASEPDTEATLVANSTLPRLMERVSLLDGSLDNLIDNANCFLVDLPVTVAINGTTITVNSSNDYPAILELLSQSDNTSVAITYPITIILSDYTAITIENQAALLAQVATCAGPNQPDIDIECVDFQYPFSIAVFDVNFEVTETVTILDDETLFYFLQTLSSGVIASINYPISLVKADGTVITVNTNEELETAIASAENTCDEDDDNNHNDANCTEAQVSASLVDCFWRITNFAGNQELEYEFYFTDDGSFTFSTDPTSSTVYTGNWEVAISEGSLVLNVSNINTELTVLNGSWIIDECSEDQLTIHSGNQEITLQKVCENATPFECFENLQTTICDEENPFDGFVAMNLEQLFINTISCTQEFTYSFHYSQVDAETDVSPIFPTSYTNTSSQETLYLRIEDLQGTFQIFTINISVEECCTNNTVLTENLVLYMPFANETKDLVSNWEASNTYNYVADRAGNSACAIAFNGNEMVEIPVTNTNQIVQGDSFSVSLWFKMQNTNPSNYEILFQKGSAVSEGFQISVFDLNTPVFSDADSGYGLWDDPWNMDANLPTDTTNWHHLVITVDGNNTVGLYRDGAQQNVDENASIDIGNTPLMNYILGNGFEGHLDDIRVYKTALNPNQVSVLYNLEADCNVCL